MPKLSLSRRHRQTNLTMLVGKPAGNNKTGSQQTHSHDTSQSRLDTFLHRETPRMVSDEDMMYTKSMTTKSYERQGSSMSNSSSVSCSSTSSSSASPPSSLVLSEAVSSIKTPTRKKQFMKKRNSSSAGISLMDLLPSHAEDDQGSFESACSSPWGHFVDMMVTSHSSRTDEQTTGEGTSSFLPCCPSPTTLEPEGRSLLPSPGLGVISVQGGTVRSITQQPPQGPTCFVRTTAGDPYPHTLKRQRRSLSQHQPQNKPLKGFVLGIPTMRDADRLLDATRDQLHNLSVNPQRKS